MKKSFLLILLGLYSCTLVAQRVDIQDAENKKHTYSTFSKSLFYAEAYDELLNLADVSGIMRQCWIIPYDGKEFLAPIYFWMSYDSINKGTETNAIVKISEDIGVCMCFIQLPDNVFEASVIIRDKGVITQSFLLKVPLIHTRQYVENNTAYKEIKTPNGCSVLYKGYLDRAHLVYIKQLDILIKLPSF